jgi:hypothetical protein
MWGFFDASAYFNSIIHGNPKLTHLGIMTILDLRYDFTKGS